MADDRIQRPNIPYTPDRYDAQNEAAFRREVGTMVHEVDAALLRFADTVSSGLITHASSHAPGGADSLASYYAELSHTHVEADITDLQSYLLNITGEPLSDLSDVTITTIASGELLKWNGTGWVNNTLAEAGISAVGHTHVEADITDLGSYSVVGHTHTESDITDLGAYLLNITGEPLGDLSDVTISAVASGEVLGYTTGWINRTLAEAGISAVGHAHTESDISDLQSYLLNITGEPLSDLSDVTITTIASGEILKWNGSIWINNTLAEAGISATGHTHVEANITDLQAYLLNITGESLGDLGNVTDASNAAGWYLRSTAAATWVAQLGLTEGDVTAHEGALSITESQISDLGAYLLNITGESIEDLSDVTSMVPNDNDVLTWHAAGGYWEAQPVPGGGVSLLSDVGDVDAYDTLAAGEVLVYSGTGWQHRTKAEADLAVLTGGNTFTGTQTFDGTQDIVITPGAVPKISSTGTIQYEVPTGSYHYWTINSATVGTLNAAGALTLGPSTTVDLLISEATAGQWTIDARSTNDLNLKGTEVWIDDGGTNKARAASVKAITASATAPTGDYPYGTLHLIY